MDYIENALSYEDYRRLRQSVGWTVFSKTQAESSLKNGLYTVAASRNGQIVGMGRLIGDGMYCMIVDLVVQPVDQQMGIGSKILNMIVDYVERETPSGGRSSIQLIAEKGKEIF